MTDVAAGADTEAALLRMRAWWQSLDADTRSILDSIAAEQPDLVVRVITGGEVDHVDMPDGLDALLTSEDFLSTNDMDLPTILVTTEGTADPESPEPGEAFTLSWTEMNDGSDSEDYVSQVDVLVDGATVATYEINCGALASREAAERSVQIEGLDPGTVYFQIWANRDGSDPGVGMPGPEGFRSGGSGRVVIGGMDDSRPSSPGEADIRGVVEAFSHIENLRSYPRLNAENVETLTQALYAFAAVPSDDLQAQLVTTANDLASLDTDRLPGETPDEWEDALVAAGQALYPLTGGGIFGEEMDEYIAEAVQALVDLAEVVFRAR